MPPIPAAPTIRRTACSLALPGIPLILLVSTLVSPTDSTDNATQLTVASTHATTWQTAALLELLAAALFPLAAGGIVHLVRRRGSTLAQFGALITGLGGLGMAAIALRHLFIYGLTATDQPTALHVLDRVDNHAGAAALPLMIAGPVGLILLAGAAARARLVSRWIVLGAMAFAIADSVPLPAAEEIQGLIGVATFGAIAFRMLRLSGRDWEAPAALSPADADSQRPLASAPARA